MSNVSGQHPTVIRTERGLSVAGTRVTLYQVMDYVTAGWPPKLIRDRLHFTEQQVRGSAQAVREWVTTR